VRGLLVEGDKAMPVQWSCTTLVLACRFQNATTDCVIG
jgi:hypothetical protein